MKKQLLIISLLLFLSQMLFAGEIDTGELITGKWMNKSDGFNPNPLGQSDHTVERYKLFTFYEDQTFLMDSAKSRYTGKWHVDGELLVINYDIKAVVHYSKNIDPNNRSSNYETTDDIVELGVRTGTIKDGKLSLDDGKVYTRYSSSVAGLKNFWEFTGFANATSGHLVMLLIGLFFIFLAIRFHYEPLLLIPIGVGILIGNIPMFQAVDFNLGLGVYEPGSVMNILYGGVLKGWYPPLIFLGIGAMTDFSSLISKPKLMLLGAAAQFGIFATFILALAFGFAPPEAGAIGIIGGADGPTAIFLSSKLANGVNIMANGETVKNLIGPIAIAAYSYMALVPVIQPPIVRLMTTKKERQIKMNPPRAVSKLEKIIFPIVGLLLTAYISPTSLPLLGMLFFGNLLKESGVTKRLADTAANSLIDVITILLGITVGASTQADIFLTSDSLMIFVMGALSFMFATASGVFFAKIMNWCSPKDNPINPMIGASGVSAVPDSARVIQEMGLKEDPSNHLLMQAMAPNVAGVIGSAVGAGILLSFLM
jgi:oxaloacetate decarboxylase beta subunit